MVSQPVQLTQPDDLPALTDSEAELLAHFVILRYDMVAFAESLKLNAHQLLAFARSRAVQAHLAELRKFADSAFALRALESRISAIDTLEAVAKNSPDLVEKRRAASAILRGLNPSHTSRPPRASTPFRASLFSDQPAAMAHVETQPLGPATPISPSLPSDLSVPHHPQIDADSNPAASHPTTSQPPRPSNSLHEPSLITDLPHPTNFRLATASHSRAPAHIDSG